MKKTIPTLLISSLTLTSAASSSAAILASWDTFAGNTTGNNFFVAAANDPNVSADSVMAGLVATLTDEGGANGFIRDIQTTSGSGDGDFGTLETGASMSAGRLRIQNVNPNQTTANLNGEPGDINLNLTNNTGSTITFDNVLFDFLAQESNTGATTHEDYSVVFENTTTMVTSGVLGSGSATFGGYTDVDIDASSLTLPDGESGRFIITLSGADAGSSSSAILDNFAVTGSTIPEPSSLALLALGGLAFARRRRA